MLQPRPPGHSNREAILTCSTLVVTSLPAPKNLPLPDSVTTSVALLLHLRESGTLSLLGERIQIPRQGGYPGIDFVIFFVLLFGATVRHSIKSFYLYLLDRKLVRVLGALAGRRRIASQSSISRGLDEVPIEMVRKNARWMLVEGGLVPEVLRHPWVMNLDGLGRGWHFFDYDGTVEVLRQRHLHRDEDTDRPPPRRRSENLAAPGYPGRKRGDVQVHRSMLSHAGSGMALDARMAPGNGERRAELASALATLCAVCEMMGHPLSQALIRMDGEFGWVPELTACKEAGVPCITRCNHLHLLDQDDIWQRMRTGTWWVVPDSGGGPVRSAMDLGLVTLQPGKDTLRDDGTPYAPIEVRIIVSRYERAGEAEHGRVIDGWQYELFAALNVPADAFPAPFVVQVYFGRSGQENRFAQEDREMRLNHIYSRHLPGQELVTLLGLMVWNLLIALGIRQSAPPQERPAPMKANMQEDLRPVPSPAITAAVEPQADSAPSAAVEPVPSPPPLPIANPPSLDEAKAAFGATVSGLKWSRWLSRHEGWTQVPEEGALRCPQGILVSPHCLGRRGTFASLHLRAPAADCARCVQRPACMLSVSEGTGKLVGIGVPRVEQPAIAQALATLQEARRHHRSAQIRSQPTPSGRPRLKAPGTPVPVVLAEEATPMPQFTITPPCLDPAASRNLFRNATSGLVIEVEVEIPEPERRHPLFVGSASERQHRRQTWSERVVRFALPAKAQVCLRLHGAERVSAALPWLASAEARSAG